MRPTLGTKLRRTVGTLLISGVLITGITALFSLTHPKSGTTAVETRANNSEQYPSANDLRQNDWGSPNHSIYIDDASKKTLRDPDSYKFISATRWTQDVASYGSKAWICQARDIEPKTGLVDTVYLRKLA